MALHTIEICAGVGMLGEGLRAGLTHLGLALRTVCYLEREAYPAAVLAARCEEGSLDPAPIWSDLLTFDAAAWRGAVDGIVAGFPCQDLSLAGKRAGLDGKRSGLFFDILDIADACGAWFLFLENVAGIATATASVVDEAEGALEERAAARVLGELADRGWNAEWLTLSASDVGASHGRERWFCFAWRMDDAQRAERRPQRVAGIGSQQGHDGGWAETHGGSGESDEALGHSECARRAQAGRGHAQHAGRESEPGCCAVADAGCGHAPGRQHISGACRVPPEYQPGCGPMADTDCDGLRTGEQRQREPLDPAPREHTVAHASSAGLSQRTRGGGLREQAHERGTRPDPELHGRPLFAPGPADPAWAGILQQWPGHAPALEPDFRGMVDGMAFAMDQSRAQRLKCVGNGVVAICAATAFVVLARRSGIMTKQPLDLVNTAQSAIKHIAELENV